MDSTKKDIRAFVRLFEESNWDELRIETSDLKLVISKNADAAGLTVSDTPSRSRAAAPSTGSTKDAGSVAGKVARVIPEGLVPVTAPSLGTFWRAPKPGAPPYIEIGQKVDAETTVCLIEVMKLFTPIKAGVSGTIIEIVADNSDMVEFGDLLLLVDPAK